MNHTLVRCCAALLLLALGLFWHKPAEAAPVSCSASMSTLDFGDIDTQANQAFTSSGTLTYSCTNNSNNNYGVAICLSIGEPNFGQTNPRQMQSGANKLNFQLYQDAAYSQVWGSQILPTAGAPLLVPVLIPGKGSIPPTGITVYGKVLAGQTATPPGLYTDQYGAVDLVITTNLNKDGDPPKACGISTFSFFDSGFIVRANVTRNCNVWATTLDFGTFGLLNSNITSNSSPISVQCSRGTPYQIGLDAGLNGNGDINARKMVKGANSITYQLYRDSAMTQVWGNTLNTNTVAGTGNGIPVDIPVYAEVPVQTTPPAGTYQDTVVVSVTY